MKSKIICFVLCSIIISLMLVPIRAAAASNSCTLMQAYIDEKVLDIIARGDFDLQSADVKVANRQSKITDYSAVSEGKIHIRTTILVDVSTSMPYATRTKVIEFIEAKIKELAGYEELRIVTFGDNINVIQDFSSDRYDLSNAAKGIEFTGQASAIYDAINSTIPHSEASDGSPFFYRTIVITDGADYTAGGITKEELFMRLRTETYPIDVIGVSKDKLTTPDKDLAALSRISNGSYSELYSGSDVSECISNVSLSDLFWIRAEVPVNLLDGSTRQVDISDGKNSFSFDMKMSVVDAPIENPPVSESSSSSSSSVMQSVSSSSSETLLNPTVSDEDDEKLQIGAVILIIIIAVVVAAAAGIVVVIIRKSKKKKQQAQTIQHSYPIVNSSLKIGATEIVEENDGREHYSIKISNVVNQNDSWILDVFSDIIIGRAENCAIIIDEKSVSREQCKIAANKNGLAISNLSSSNKTKLNGTALVTEVLLHPADNIHFGRVTLRVDYIQKVTDEVPPQSPPSQNPSSGNSGIGKTKSIF